MQSWELQYQNEALSKTGLLNYKYYEEILFRWCIDENEFSSIFDFKYCRIIAWFGFEISLIS